MEITFIIYSSSKSALKQTIQYVPFILTRFLRLFKREICIIFKKIVENTNLFNTKFTYLIIRKLYFINDTFVYN